MAISQTIEQVLDETVIIQDTGFTADTNTGTVVDALGTYGFIPDKVGISVVRSAGATAVVDVDIQHSYDNTNFTQAVNATASDGTVVTATGKLARYWRVYITTVGVGNTLTVNWMVKQ